jgi:hypothetical protein
MSTHDFDGDQESLFQRPVPDPLYAPDTESPSEHGDSDGPDPESVEVARAAAEEAKTDAVMNHYRV